MKNFNEAVRNLTVWAILPNSSNVRVEKILSEKGEDDNKITPLAKAFGMESSSIKKLIDKEIDKIQKDEIETDKKNKELRTNNQHLKIVWTKP